MLRILLVDHDEAYLDSLRSLFETLSSEFACTYAVSAEKARFHLERQPFDAVIANMRMPEETGAELLSKVHQTYPKISRLLMTAQSDMEAMATWYGVTQQFVLKPCDGEKLIQTLRDLSDLRSKTQSPYVFDIVGKFQTLPTMDPAYLELMKLLTAGASSDQIAVSLAKDSVFSARILQLSNSPYFGPARRVVSLTDAINILGHNLTRTLLISHQASKFCKAKHGKYMAMIGEQTEKIATVMKIITPKEYRSDEATSIGILSNVGKYILLAAEPEAYGKILEETKGNPSEAYRLEQERFKTTHAEIGGFLLGLWGLPYSAIRAVTNHHIKGEIVQSPALYALDLADRVAFSATGEVEVPDPIDYDDPFRMDAKLRDWKTNFTMERSAI